ncbi:MAG: hypothetical protein JOY89_12760 [Solirubrobacterales bacterium]|nr:hypothetical protein [Solirubrobacterales bacterium]
MLDRPVRRVGMTTVHYPRTSALRFEDRVTVLVDPSRPDYAEFPGVRLKSSSAWILWALAAVLFAVVGVVDGRGFLEVLSFRRMHRAEVRGSPAPGSI